MSKYPEEIVKAAETLIEKHYFAVWPADSKEDFALYKGKSEEYTEATRSAIVSCEFALPLVTQNSFDGKYDKLLQIKSYLEELL